jgi:soluble lytic murein transglycosylase-like protein
MFPAICRGRALHLGLLALVTPMVACASTGPGTAPPLVPAERPIGASGSGAQALSLERRSSPNPRRPAHPVPVRRVRVDSAALELTVTKRLAQRPLAMVLERSIKDSELVDRVASAIVYEAGRARLSPSLLAGVLLIENSRFDTSAVSMEGAIGLMQVMPLHVGSYRCLSGDLVNVEANICHGARLLSSYVHRARSVESGLRRYNGCVRGRNTPRCQRYPIRVLRTASRVRREMLVNAERLDPTVFAPTVASATLGSDLPAAVVDEDPVQSTEPSPCATLMGCLRQRWSSSR